MYIYIQGYIQGGIWEFLYNIQVIYVKQNKQNKNKGKNRRRNIKKKEETQKSNGIANQQTKNKPESLPKAQSLAQSTQIGSKCPNTHTKSVQNAQTHTKQNEPVLALTLAPPPPKKTHTHTL